MEEKRRVLLPSDQAQDFYAAAAAFALEPGDFLALSNFRVGTVAEGELILQRDPDRGLWKILDPQEKLWHGLEVDFAEASFRFRVARTQQSKEILRDALKIKGKFHSMSVLDATAGLGEDAFMMAHWGHVVRSFEKNALIYFLLRQGWARFQAEFPTEAAAMCWEIFRGDSLPEIDRTWDVLYLDPMYPHVSHKKALNSKALRVLGEILSEAPPSDRELEDLLQTSHGKIHHKIILKRPLKSEVPRSPRGFAYYSLKSASTRLDIYNVTAV